MGFNVPPMLFYDKGQRVCNPNNSQTLTEKPKVKIVEKEKQMLVRTEEKKEDEERR